ncbi:hypothetical protein GGR56DRAFT_270391 [Xylariaceae sp. FL0804]|nr:hypothetical protein GGR56DRAFT_270391 [Xylariaceae sp. FL0804]
MGPQVSSRLVFLSCEHLSSRGASGTVWPCAVSPPVLSTGPYDIYWSSLSFSTANRLTVFWPSTLSGTLSGFLCYRTYCTQALLTLICPDDGCSRCMLLGQARSSLVPAYAHLRVLTCLAWWARSLYCGTMTTWIRIACLPLIPTQKSSSSSTRMAAGQSLSSNKPRASAVAGEASISSLRSIDPLVMRTAPHAVLCHVCGSRRQTKPVDGKHEATVELKDYRGGRSSLEIPSNTCRT